MSYNKIQNVRELHMIVTRQARARRRDELQLGNASGAEWAVLLVS